MAGLFEYKIKTHDNLSSIILNMYGTPYERLNLSLDNKKLTSLSASLEVEGYLRMLI